MLVQRDEMIRLWTRLQLAQTDLERMAARAAIRRKLDEVEVTRTVGTVRTVRVAGEDGMPELDELQPATVAQVRQMIEERLSGETW